MVSLFFGLDNPMDVHVLNFDIAINSSVPFVGTRSVQVELGEPGAEAATTAAANLADRIYQKMVAHTITHVAIHGAVESQYPALVFALHLLDQRLLNNHPALRDNVAYEISCDARREFPDVERALAAVNAIFLLIDYDPAWDTTPTLLNQLLDSHVDPAQIYVLVTMEYDAEPPYEALDYVDDPEHLVLVPAASGSHSQLQDNITTTRAAVHELRCSYQPLTMD